MCVHVCVCVFVCVCVCVCVCVQMHVHEVSDQVHVYGLPSCDEEEQREAGWLAVFGSWRLGLASGGAHPPPHMFPISHSASGDLSTEYSVREPITPPLHSLSLSLSLFLSLSSGP